ncbi:hypothetical protein B0H13DRAFT_1957153, partial [Mycena leptocephala]
YFRSLFLFLFFFGTVPAIHSSTLGRHVFWQAICVLSPLTAALSRFDCLRLLQNADFIEVLTRIFGPNQVSLQSSKCRRNLWSRRYDASSRRSWGDRLSLQEQMTEAAMPEKPDCFHFCHAAI